jgi:hypothetical protein
MFLSQTVAPMAEEAQLEHSLLKVVSVEVGELVDLMTLEYLPLEV